MAHHQGHLGAVQRLARPQEDRHRLAGDRLVDVDGHEAAAVVVGVEQAKLLLAVGPVLGVVDVQDDAPGNGGEADAEQFHHGRHHALQRHRARQVLQARHRRLRAQVASGFRRAAAGHLERRVSAQPVAVFGIRITRGDRQGAEPDHLSQPMNHPLRRARILDAARQPVGDLQSTFHLRQKQDASVRRQPPTVEATDDGLAANR
nr:hypothetical protein [Nitrospirillum amazonense]